MVGIIVATVYKCFVKRSLLSPRTAYTLTEATAVPMGELLISYDLMHVQLKQIVTLLKDLNHPIAPGAFRDLWRSWIYFTKENEFENMHAPNPDC